MKKLFGGIVALVVTAMALLGLAFGVCWATTQPPPALARTTQKDSQLPAATLGGYRFHLETRGSKGRPVVIVLHGGPGNDYRYLLPLERLADEYQLVFYDQRGSGLSPRVPSEQLNLRQFVADLHAVGRRFSPDSPVRLVGHSWGAMLAAAFISAHPERVSHAVLAEPGFLNPQTGEHFVSEFQKRLHVSPRSLVALFKLGASALRLPVADDDEDARLDYFAFAVAQLNVPGNPMLGYYCGADLRTASLPTWRLGARANLSVMKSGFDSEGQVVVNFAGGFHRFKHEVLLLASSCNEIIGEATQRQHAALFPNARVEVIREAGHTMLGERLEASLAVIRPYLAQKQTLR